eukprot:g7.t1 g7   contig1:15547-15984(-)
MSCNRAALHRITSLQLTMSSSTATAATDPTDDSGPPAIVDTAINTMAQSQSTLDDDGSTMAYSSVRHITSAHDGQPLSTETLLEDDGSSGQVQLYVENDVDTPPDHRMKFISFWPRRLALMLRVISKTLQIAEVGRSWYSNRTLL